MEKLQQALEKARQQRQGRNTPGTFPAARGETGRAAGDHGQRLIDPARLAGISFERDHLQTHKIVVDSEAGHKAGSLQRTAADAFRMIRTRALQAMNDRETGAARIIGLTSGRQGDGKTTIAVNLSLALARQPDTRVLLVDADLTRPTLAQVLGLEARLGCSDFLIGKAAIEDCLLKVEGLDLFILPQRKPIIHSSELIAGGIFRSFLERLRREKDWIVILDCPPILAIDDTLVIKPLIDGLFLVVREGHTRKAEMRRAAERIGESHYLGCILNDSRMAALGGQYYYYHQTYEAN